MLVVGPSPLDPQVWVKAIPDFARTIAQLVAVPLQWLASGQFLERGAYSLAILLQEHADKVAREFSIQVFATDIDHDAIEKARGPCISDVSKPLNRATICSYSVI